MRQRRIVTRPQAGGGSQAWQRSAARRLMAAALARLAGLFQRIAALGVVSADPDVLYTMHIDSDDASFDPDVSIHARFAQNGAGEWGVQLMGIPGTPGPVVGRVGATLDLAGALAYTGVREDPFFFDLQGFQTTLMTGTLAFDPTRDFFAGGNVSAIVVQIPLRALPGSGPYQIWATTGRI